MKNAGGLVLGVKFKNSSFNRSLIEKYYLKLRTKFNAYRLSLQLQAW